MKNVSIKINNKSLTNSINEKLKFDFESRITNKQIINMEKSMKTNKQVNGTGSAVIKSNFTLYKNNIQKQNIKIVKNNNSNFSDRNPLKYGLSKDKISKSSIIRTNIRKDNERSVEKISSLSPMHASSIRKNKVFSTRETSSKHQHTKSDISELKNSKKFESVIPLTNFLCLTKNSKLNGAPEKNINLVYSELAKQLKRNKNSEYEFSRKDSNFSGREKDSVNQSSEHMKQSNLIFSNRSNANLSSTLGYSKTSKENICSTGNLLVNNLSKGINPSSEFLNFSGVENPEELHMFYVTFVQKSKRLAYKFDNLSEDSNLIIGNLNK